MKVLIFEYITGGGFNRQELPVSLLREGLMMLRALLKGFQQLHAVELVVLLDERLLVSVDAGCCQVVTISPADNYEKKFMQAMAFCDAIWVIAPETGGILHELCRIAEKTNKLVLNAAAEVVVLTGDKFSTYQHLQGLVADMVPTWRLDGINLNDSPVLSSNQGSGWMIKAIDGVGCENSRIVDRLAEVYCIEKKTDFIIQPHLQGRKTSLSCLFKQGRVWLVCVNEQHFDVVDQQYRLRGITVNIDSPFSRYEAMLTNVAAALPGLWGYVGIDLIENDGQVLLLEINPRLTTSFVGIYDALGINIPEQVLCLVDGDPALTAQHNRTVEVIINE